MSTQKASTKPPVLDGTNYPLWKLRMRAYISAQDGFAWEAVERGWKPPVVKELSSFGQIVSKPKPKEKWTKLELKLSMGNSKAINAIFGAVDQEQFKHISSFSSAKEAWDKLQHVHEGTELGGDSSDCSLTRVHEKLRSLAERSNDEFIFRYLLTQRKENEMAYEPEMLSIGPYHHGKSKYQKMEMYKLEYLQGILNRREEMSAERYIEVLSIYEAEARNCYSRDAQLNQDIDFVEMMLLDGCFIIEFLRKYNMNQEEWKDDPVFRMKWLVEILCRDMLLFENQLPFFILELLFEETRNYDDNENLIHLAISCLNHCISADNVSDSSYIINRPETSVLHLLSLMYDSWCSSFAKAKYVKEPKHVSLHHYVLDFSAVTLQKLSSNLSQKGNTTDLEYINSVSELGEYGIKFSKAILEEKEKEEKEEDGTKFKAIHEEQKIPISSSMSRSWLDIKFENGEMKIPTLVVQDHTESLLRNLIAYEEYTIDPRYSGKVVSDYTTFMNCLVNSSKDVKTLREQSVIENLLGNDEVLSGMFNRIRPNVSLNSPWFSYREIFMEVNEHCSKRRNRWITDLKKNYFNNPWSITAFLAATFLLVLTLLQTIFSIL